MINTRSIIGIDIIRKNLLNSVFGNSDIRMEANMSIDNYKKLEHKLEEINRLKEIFFFLHWDRSVVMPAGATSLGVSIWPLWILKSENQSRKLGAVIEKIELSELDPWQRRNVELAEKMYRHHDYS
jgi:Zn-dependent M32 family carboxypeptidase